MPKTSKKTIKKDNHTCENNIENNMCEPYCRICKKPMNKETELREKRSKYWNQMVDIVDEFFPKGKCKERGSALMVLAHIEMILKKDNSQRKAELEEIKSAIESIKKITQQDYGTFKYDSCYDECITLITNRINKSN